MTCRFLDAVLALSLLAATACTPPQRFRPYVEDSYTTPLYEGGRRSGAIYTEVVAETDGSTVRREFLCVRASQCTLLRQEILVPPWEVVKPR